MNTILFANEINTPQLDGLRICLAGTFAIPTNDIKKRLMKLGAAKIDIVSQESKNEVNTLPVKETTNLFVIGTNVPTNCLIRYEMNCHDGYKAVKISENELYSFMKGDLVLNIPKCIVKHIDIDYNYYYWTAPKNQVLHKSSPYIYDMNSVHSPVYGRELFIPNMENIDMFALGQIVGNLGGFSNDLNLPNSDMIMLPDTTVEMLKQGKKDAIIRKIENDYNKGTSKIFSCCFTCVSDFMKWVHYRLSLCPDPPTQALVNRLYL